MPHGAPALFFGGGLGFWEIVGWGGSALVVLAMMQRSILRLRMLAFVGGVVLVIYNVVIAVWPMAALNTALCTIHVVAMIGLAREARSQKNYQVVALAPDHALVDYLRQVHASDIARFFPRSHTQAATHAFLAMRGDAIAALVLARLEGQELNLTVDYAPERFRDLSPAKALLHADSPLMALPWRTLVTADGGPSFYAQLGFTRTGTHFTFQRP